MPGAFRSYREHQLWTASLLRKDDHDMLDSIKVFAPNKTAAIEQANTEFKKLYKNYWHYAYVWVAPIEQRS